MADGVQLHLREGRGIWYNTRSMRILFRYVLREFAVPLCYSLAGFVSIYVLFELFGSFSRLIDSDMTFGMTVKYFTGYLAPYFQYLAPAALMLAALYTMWNFCRHSELVAMRASGVSLVSVAAPIFLAATAMAGLVMWTNEVYVPDHAQWAARLKAAKFDSAKAARSGKLDYRNNRDNRIWSADEVLDVRGRALGGVSITEDRPGGAQLYSITADKALWLDGEWWLENPVVQHYDAKGVQTATPTPELDALPLRVFPNLTERPGDLMAQSRKQQYNSVAGKLRHLKSNMHLSDETRREYAYSAWAQLVSPFACIVVTLFAIPFGIASGRQSVFKGVVATLGLFFLFYAFVIGGMVAANEGFLHPIPAAVAPYAIFFIVGLRAFFRQR